MENTIYNTQTNNIDNYTNIINNLLVTYKSNEYILERLNHFLIGLPETMENENKRYEERLAKYNELLSEQDNFFKIFLCKNQYYYMPFNNLYYEYNQTTFKLINEDDIYHKLLSTITHEGKLIQWKHKTKQMMIKKIKGRLLVKATPESETIQNVLNLCKIFFETKAEAKYFLTFVGDCILKKQTNNLYFVNSHFKKILNLIDSICYVTSGNTIFKNIITKYHNSHELEKYCLIKTLDSIDNLDAISYDNIKNTINDLGIDLLVVASHYSEQYGDSNGYLTDFCSDVTVKDHILYFRNNDTNKIINNFISSCIEVTNTIDSKITWANMHFIWKQYIASLNIPNMIYSDDLEKELMKPIQYTYEDKHATFIGVTSKYLPNVSSFLSFFNKYITIEDGDTDSEYEIDELCSLYKSTEFKHININEKSMFNMITHFYPNLEIINNKIVTNIKCFLWIKSVDINEYLEDYIETNKNKSVKAFVSDELVSFDTMYQRYRTYFKNKSFINKTPVFIVSKQYFENFIQVNLSNHIQFEKFLYFKFVSV